jgi:hypothetical protein
MRIGVTVKRSAAAVILGRGAVAAAAAGVAAVVAAGCGGASLPAAGSGGLPTASAFPSAFPSASTPGSGGASAPAPSACSLLRAADVTAVAATFKDIKITITAHTHKSEPPTNNCAFNQKGTFVSGGMTNTESGDRWAQLTVVSGGASYDYEPAGNVPITGLGDGAYWEQGTHQVVVREGQNILQVTDEVPVNVNDYSDITVAYRKAAQALAEKIVSHL